MEISVLFGEDLGLSVDLSVGIGVGISVEIGVGIGGEIGVGIVVVLRYIVLLCVGLGVGYGTLWGFLC